MDGQCFSCTEKFGVFRKECFSCTEKFGVFRKEHTCKNCHYLFCSKCLNHSIALPNQGPKEHNVCTKCYKQLTAPPGSNDGEQTGGYQDYMDPPENYKKRMAALAQKNNQSSSSTTRDVPSSQKGSQDGDITQRVERLRSERRKLRGRTPSSEELEVRIQKLRSYSLDSKPSDSGTTSAASFQAPEQRTQHEQTQDLLKQVGEEAAIDSRMEGTESSEQSINIPASSSDPTTLEEQMEKLMQDARDELKRGREDLAQEVEITLRIANLKMKANAATAGKQSEDDDQMAVDEEDEEAASQRVIQQLLEQDRLEARGGGLGQTAHSNQPSAAAQKPPNIDPDELPWCCICNEDASLRCHGCDDDLYCNRCFREGHDGFDLQDHRTSKYRQPKAGQS